MEATQRQERTPPSDFPSKMIACSRCLLFCDWESVPMIANHAPERTIPKPLPGKAKVSEKAIGAGPVAGLGALLGAWNPSVLKNADRASYTDIVGCTL
jgi:hypothetical protein